MKKLNRIISILIFSLVATKGSLASAYQKDIAVLRDSIHSNAEALIKSFDPEATFVIELPAEIKEQKLSGTPFLFENINTDINTGKIIFGEATINIYSQKSQLPDHIEEGLKKILGNYDIKGRIELIAVSSDTKSFVQSLFATLLKPVPLTLTLATLALYGLLIMNLTSRKKEATEVKESLKSGLSQIASALSEKTSNMAPEAFADSESKKDTNKEHSAENSQNDRLLFGSLNNESALEIIADCYWCEQDSYAAYIWPRLKLETRQYIASQQNWLAEYGRIVSQIPEENLGLHFDPYYIDPLPLCALSNSDLKDLAQKDLSLFNALSPLRGSFVKIKAKLRLEALDLKPMPKAQAQDVLKKIKPSNLRDLSSLKPLEVNSVEEETELLGLKNLDARRKSMIPSLIWAADLSEHELQEILKDFSAQNLASAWVAPKDTLQFISNALPEKKRALTLSYVEKTKPSRKSPTYKAICRRITEELKKKNTVSAVNEPLQKAS